MAPRPKRSSQMQNPAIEYVDKAAFGLLVLVLGYAVYSAITHPTYEKRPEELRTQAETKLTAINTARPDDSFKEQFPVENFAAKVSAANQPIKPEEFAITTPFFVDRTAVLGEKRGQPELLPAVELSARFVRMSIATNPTPTATATQTAPMGPGAAPAGPRPGRRTPMADLAGEVSSESPEGGEGGGRGYSSSGLVPKGKMAVVVVGRVPVQDQLLKYQQEFLSSRFSDRERDVPFYVTFLLERADVTHDPENPQWTSVVDGQSLIAANLLEMSEWAGTAQEVVDITHVRPLELDQTTGAWRNFTSPLPPRLLEEWSSEVTCKSIKKLEPTTDPLLGGAATPETQQQVASIPMGNPFANPFQNNVPLPAQGNRNPAGTPDAGARRNDPQKKDGMSDILLRFFDFKVEPNHRYQYRVKLVLRNPNFNLPDRYLKDPSVAKQQYVFSPDSEPTPVVTVSGYSEVIAGGVDPPRGINEATASIIIRNRDADTGAIVAYEFPGVERGAMLNFEVAKKTVRGKTVGALMPNPATSKVSVAEHAVFKSNEMLLDLRGGDNLPSPHNRRVKETSGVLVLDENGWLHVRGEFADQAEPYMEEKLRLDQLAASLEPDVKPMEGGAESTSAEGGPLGGRVGGGAGRE